MLYKNIDGVDTPMTAEEEAEHLASLRPRIEVVTEKVRLLRNDLLANTDWTQMVDVSQTVKDKYTAYRQALRDVPSQSGFPENIQWPTKPE